jgi:tripeptide aminopeptidase
MHMHNLVNRFLSYVAIDTQSDPLSNTTPSTEKQWDLANKLVEELVDMGLEEVTIDENSYIMPI